MSQQKKIGVVGGVEFIATNVLTAWADIKTKSTPTFVNGVNAGISTTHIFTIRYTQSYYTQLQELTQKYWVSYNGKRYNVNVLENVNEENALIRFIASVRGKDDKEFTKTR